MSTPTQTNPDSAIQAQLSDNAPKSMKGKYDGRGKYKRTAQTRERSRINGPKSFAERHLSRNSAAKIFRKLSIQEECAKLLESADLRLRFEVIRYLWDRLEGKPFTAVNPAEAKQVATVNNDNRLQNAIINLIPGGAPKPKKKAKLLVAESEVVAESGINSVSQS